MISTKKSVIILFWQEPSIFLRINLFIDDVLQIIVKSIIFKTRITVLNFIEKGVLLPDYLCNVQVFIVI